MLVLVGELQAVVFLDVDFMELAMAVTSEVPWVLVMALIVSQLSGSSGVVRWEGTRCSLAMHEEPLDFTVYNMLFLLCYVVTDVVDQMHIQLRWSLAKLLCKRLTA